MNINYDSVFTFTHTQYKLMEVPLEHTVLYF